MNRKLLYSDGACSGNPGPGGWAYVLFDGVNTVREGAAYAPQTTNNRMEMTGVLEGLRAMAEQTVPVETLPPLILTDSSYVVFGITKWIHNWKKRDWKTIEGGDVNNRDLWEALEAQVKIMGRLEWKIVPGHSGIPGNERCDELAVTCQKGQTSFSKEYSLSEYHFDISTLPDFTRYAKREPYYLSYINGVLEKHTQWSQCEARIKNRPGAKFKKIKNLNEEEEILKSW